MPVARQLQRAALEDLEMSPILFKVLYLEASENSALSFSSQRVKWSWWDESEFGGVETFHGECLTLLPSCLQQMKSSPQLIGHFIRSSHRSNISLRCQQEFRKSSKLHFSLGTCWKTCPNCFVSYLSSVSLFIRCLPLQHGTSETAVLLLRHKCLALWDPLAAR